MASTNSMLQSLSGMLDTEDFNDWEHDFVESVWDKSKEGKRPDLLSPPQVEKVEQVYKKYFAS